MSNNNLDVNDLQILAKFLRDSLEKNDKRRRIEKWIAKGYRFRVTVSAIFKKGHWIKLDNVISLPVKEK